MITSLLHPSDRRLADFADGTLDERGTRRVAGHLAECADCRGAVASIRDLAHRAHALEAPALPADAWQKVIARREAGERVILPTNDPVVTRRRWLPIAAGVVAAAGLLILIPSSGWRSTPMLVAAGPVKTGTLRFDPAVANAGEAVRVEYRSNGLFSGFETLRLRGQFSKPGPECGSSCSRIGRASELAMLQRDASGVFRGSFVFPAEALLGIFAVEDSGARFIDHAGLVRPEWWDVNSTGRPAFWDLMVGDTTGGPSFESLRMRETHWFQYNKPRAIETARIMTRLFPDRAESWNQLAYAQARLYSYPNRDNVRNAYRPRFRKLDRDLSARASLPAREVSEMFFYGEALQEVEAAARWRARLLREHPTDDVAIRFRAFDIRDRYRSDSGRFLAEMDKLSEEVRRPTTDMVDIGLQAAHAARDPQAVGRWAKLYPQGTRWRRAFQVARGLEMYPEFREPIMNMLRREIASVDSVWSASLGLEPRGLGMTVARRDSAISDTRYRRISQHWSLLQLGQVLLADGQYRAALDTLTLAIDTTWTQGPRIWGDPNVLRGMAQAHLALGDTVRATSLLMRTVALAPEDEVSELTDSVRRVVGRFHDPVKWNAELRALRDTVQRQRDSVARASGQNSRTWKAQIDSARRGLLKPKL